MGLQTVKLHKQSFLTANYKQKIHAFSCYIGGDFYAKHLIVAWLHMFSAQGALLGNQPPNVESYGAMKSGEWLHLKML